MNNSNYCADMYLQGTDQIHVKEKITIEEDECMTDQMCWQM